MLRGSSSDSVELLNKLQTYLGLICPAMLFEGAAPLGALENAMITQESTEAMMRFVSTSECSVLLVERSDSNVGEGNFSSYFLFVFNFDPLLNKLFSENRYGCAYACRDQYHCLFSCR